MTAARAASAARFSPWPTPMPISAEPASRMIVRTSAKSRLTSPGTVIRSVIPCTPWRRMSSAIRNASDDAACASRPPAAAGRSRSRSACRPCRAGSSIPCSACCARLRPSNANGRVTTPTVSASSSRAISATIGAAPVPVPPPSPAVTKTMSAPFSASFSSSRLSMRGGVPDGRVGAGAETARRLRADVDLHVGVAHHQRLRVGVHGDELDAGEARVDHPVDGVRAAAADADDLDHREVVARLVSHAHVARPQAVVEDWG